MSPRLQQRCRDQLQASGIRQSVYLHTLESLVIITFHVFTILCVNCQQTTCSRDVFCAVNILTCTIWPVSVTWVHGGTSVKLNTLDLLLLSSKRSGAFLFDLRVCKLSHLTLVGRKESLWAWVTFRKDRCVRVTIRCRSLGPSRCVNPI